MCVTSPRRLAGLTTFFQRLLQERLVQRQAGNQVLQARILSLQLLQLARLAGCRATIRFAPAIEGLFSDAN